MRHTVICRNPACQMAYFPDKAHRFNGCCSAICARKMTPNSTTQRTYKGEVGIVVTRAPINRKHGANRTEKTE